MCASLVALAAPAVGQTSPQDYPQWRGRQGVKAGDLLFLLNDGGELIVATANRAAFEPLKRYTVADRATWAQPAITGTRIFIKDTTALTLWTVE